MSIPILMTPPYHIEVPDISNWQNATAQNVPARIDFARVKASPRNVRAVMVKFGEGAWEGYPLDVALDQANGFHGVDIPVIPYHFWHYEVSPTQQATYFKGRVGQLGWKPRRQMVDIEDTDAPDAKPPGRELLASEYPVWIPKAIKIAVSVRDTLDAIAQEFGEAPLWYGGEWYQGWWTWLAGVGGLDMSWLKLYQLQCASYTVPYMYLCSGFTAQQAIFWQRCSRPPVAEQIDGFPNPAALDMNWWLKSDQEFDEWIGEKGAATMSGTYNTNVKMLDRFQFAWLGMGDKAVDIGKVCSGVNGLVLNMVSQVCDGMIPVKDTAFPIWVDRATVPVVAVVEFDQDLFWKKEIPLPVFQDATKRNLWNNETFRAIMEQWRSNQITDAEWATNKLNIRANDGGWHKVSALFFQMTTLKNHGDVINGMWQMAIVDDLLKPLASLMQGGYTPTVPIYLMANGAWYQKYANDSGWTIKARLENGQIKGLGMLRTWGEDGSTTIQTDKAPMAQPLATMIDVWQYVPGDLYTYPWVQAGVNYQFFVFSYNRFLVTDMFYPNNPITPVTVGLWCDTVEVANKALGWAGYVPPIEPPTPPVDPTLKDLQARVTALETKWIASFKF